MSGTLRITSTDIQRVYVVGAVATSSFTIPWPFFSLDDVAVYIDGELQTRGTDFDIVAIEADDIGYLGGTVVTVAPVTNARVALQRATPITRESDFPRGSSLSIDVLNRDLDKLTAIAQELQYQIGRAIRLTDHDSTNPALYLPDTTADRAGLLIGFNADGTDLALIAATGDASIITDPTKVPMTRQINAGAGLAGGGNLSSDRELWLATSGVTAGTYPLATVTVDAYGRVTSAAAGSGGGLGDVPSTRAIATAAPLTGGGTLAGDLSLGMADSGVTAGSYVNPTITVDAKGRVTAASANPSGSGVATSRQILAGTGLTGGGDLPVDRTLSLANTAVTPGTYANAQITVDQQGRITAASVSAASASLPWINVIDYGATGDGTTDDTSAVEDAINALPTRGVLYFPAGKYVLTAQLTIALGAAGKIAVMGDGPGQTVLSWTNLAASRGISVTSNAGNYWIEQASPSTTIFFRDLCLETLKVNDGTAISMNGGSLEGRPMIGPLFENIVIRGYQPIYNWAYGLDLLDCSNTDIQRSFIYQGGPGNVAGVAVSIRSTDASTDAVDHHIDGLVVLYGNTGVQIGSNCEGVHIVNSSLIAMNYGVYWDAASAESLLALVNNHISVRTRCVYMRNVKDSQINGNSFFNAGGHTDFAAIDMEACGNATVIGNTTAGTGAGTEQGFLFRGSSDPVAVANNVFRDIAGTAIWCVSGSSNVKVTNNNQARVGQYYLDQGSENTFRGGFRGARTVVTASQSQSIGSGDSVSLATLFSASTEEYDTDNFIASGRVTIPSGKSITKVRITVNVAVTGSGLSGNAQLIISKNGTILWAGGPRQEAPPYNGGSTAMQVTTGVIQVSAGDYFEPHLANTTGNTVSVVSGDNRAACWMAVEAVD